MIRTALYVLSPLRTLLLCAMSMSCLTSCVHEGAGDRFHKTLWYSSEVPLGPFDVTDLTIGFLSDGLVTIRTNSSGAVAASEEILESAAGKSFGEESTSRARRNICGHYEHNGSTAVLQNLSFTINDIKITFIEAEESGDILFLLWRVEGMLYPFTTALKRIN